MADRSKIEWTESTWNPVTGCTPARLADGQVSPGCANCYARREHDRRHKALLVGRKMAPQYAEPFDVVQLHEDRLDEPLRWRKPRRIFVCSGADLFHEDVVDVCWHGEYSPLFWEMMLGVMYLAQRHIFIILTKRAATLKALWNYEHTPPRIAGAVFDVLRLRGQYDRATEIVPELCTGADYVTRPMPWPLPNVHVGVSVENQQTADERIPLLLQTPAAVRFVSCEPLLGPVKFRHEWFGYTRPSGDFRTHQGKRQVKIARDDNAPRIDGVICGGESGPNARPMHPDWARKVRDDCVGAGVPFFFKQHGEWIHASQYTRVMAGQKAFAKEQMFCELDQQDAFFRVGKKAAGRILDGRTHDELPGSAALRRGEAGSKITTENTEATR